MPLTTPVRSCAWSRLDPARRLLLAALLSAALLCIGASGQEALDEPFPTASSKKGLQVQMVQDALDLGIRHAALNVSLGELLVRPGSEGDVPLGAGGEGFALRAAGLAALDAQVRPLSDVGVIVYAILLARATGVPERDDLLLHPAYDPEAPNRLGAFRCDDEDGRAFLRALIGALAARYTRADRLHGRIWGWIVGNEVNSHRWWYNRGPTDPATLVDSYERAVRTVHEAVSACAPSARVYLSLEHHWSIRYPAGDERSALPGRELLSRFAALARERGDFPWHLAFHPYPENLFECRTWLDASATSEEDTPRVTFKNLEVLTAFLAREELRYRGLPRRVIFSEQGFHAAEPADGERDQAAAFAYAWMRVRDLEGIDALILHRHVDHAHEGGLRLGLWTRQADSVCTPERPRRIHEVFRACDGPDAEEALRFALEVIGIPSWSEIAKGR